MSAFSCCTLNATVTRLVESCISAWNACGVVGFFEQVGLTVEKEFHRVANALSYEYRFAHSYSRLVYEKYTYRKYVLF